MERVTDRFENIVENYHVGALDVVERKIRKLEESDLDASETDEKSTKTI